MKVIAWNVNGIRAVIKKGFNEFLLREKPDVLCLQETKIGEAAHADATLDFPGYTEFWNYAERPGYSGTAILAKQNPNAVSQINDTTREDKNHGSLLIGVKNGIGIPKFDSEGRVQTVEFEKFYLINAYFPNSNHELSRLGLKLEFNDAILQYSQKLRKEKPVLICGDFNAAHKKIDLAHPKDNEKNAGFTLEERAWVDKFVRKGYIDIFRYFYYDKVQYTWWSYRFRARERNIGWRIDYFFCSPEFIYNIEEIRIMDRTEGSDHCPVMVGLKEDG